MADGKVLAGMYRAMREESRSKQAQAIAVQDFNAPYPKSRISTWEKILADYVHSMPCQAKRCR